MRPAEQMVDRVAAHDGIADQARHNPYEDFRIGKDPAVLDAAFKSKSINDAFFRRYLDDDDLRERINEVVLRAAYERLRVAE